MNRKMLLLSVTLALTVATVAVAGPVAPHEGAPLNTHHETINGAVKAFGDPTDFLASALAGADYLVMMQADVTEDNAGNGDPDQDLEDGGWDWVTTAFEHGAATSPMNIYGATAQGLLRTYGFDPQPAYFTAMKDAADRMVAIGPDPGVRSAADVIFLLNFADLADCPDPAFYRAGAQAIWDRHISVYGSLVALAEYIRDARAGQGYPNGIIPWDIGAWAQAAMSMHAAFPAGGHDLEGAAIAEVVWQDSFNASPGYFEPFGHSQGYDPAWSTADYYWYGIGIAGLVQAFGSTGTHTAELAGLQGLMLDCQYPDGAFSDQYGAQGGDADWQGSAYILMAMYDYLPPSPALNDAIYLGAQWLVTTQDASGGWVYGSGNHYPEIGGECTAAVAVGWLAGGTSVTANLADAGPIDCSETQLVTFTYAPGDATPALRGYEITFEVTGGVAFAGADINDAGGLGAIGTHAYYETDNGGSWTVTDALLGATPGVVAGTDLFTVLLTPTGDGPVSVNVLGYRMRTVDNVDIFADVAGAAFEVDCTAPPVVTDIVADTAHHRVDVSWACTEVDVDHYEIWRGLRYDTTPGVSAYPEYDDLAGYTVPTRPADRAAALASAEWELAGTVPAGTFTFTDAGMAGRGVYDYEVFAVDSTPLYGPAAAANDWALNYWLGDVEIPYDGDVDAGDITQLGASFGLGDGDVGYNNETDVGPTSDASGTGFPATDSLIDFEDLMIFALNYGNVGPVKVLPVTGAEAPALAWARGDDGVWTLTLSRPCPNLKGLRVSAILPAGVSATVRPGTLLGEQSAPVFMQNLDGFDVSLAVLGSNLGIEGSGELLRVTFDADVEIGALAVKARGLDNHALDAQVGTSSSLPAAFAVRPNYPNPFNPSTKISFDLPRAAVVQVAVYDLDGRLVRTLLSEERAAGTHEVVWDGADAQGQRAASGTYLYRVKADGYETNRKMLLVK